jgi:hypothetical protein
VVRAGRAGDLPRKDGVPRTLTNRLGYAVLLCYLRHPGRVPDPDEIPPSALLTFVAHQVQGNELIG